jgi:peptidoglycan hydrolase CwlO-like protein
MRGIVLAATVSVAVATNPMAKVIELMDDCTAKVKKDGDAEDKAYKEYFEWCDDVSKNTQFEIKTAKAKVEELTAKIGELTSSIQASETKIEELSGSIAKDEEELKAATEIREKEAADFAASEEELMADVDTLERAIAVLDKELNKGGASALAQIDTSNTKAVMNALSVLVDAAGFEGGDKGRLMALVQQQSDDGEDDLSLGAPAPAVYESKAGAIVDVLADMKEKAESELAELRKAESNAKHNYDMLKQSLTDSVTADNTDMDQEKKSMGANSEEKATAEGDLSVTSKDLKASEDELATAQAECMEVAADHEATVTAREEELAVIAKAKKILEETSSGGVEQSYDFLQISTRAQLKNSEVIAAIKKLAKQQHSSGLAQLASRIAAVAKYGAADDVFAKIKGLITDMIAKLEKEAEEDATEKAYCDEEMGKTESKKAELEDDVSKLAAKIERNAAKSAKLKAEVKETQAELASLAKEQADMDQIRSEENADYKVAKADLELAIGGVQKALQVLRDYYGGAASFVQEEQPAKPAKHQKSSGAGQSIIGILEVCESDFTESLAKEETEESNAQDEYDKTTQANKVAKTEKEQAVKYKTQEFKGLDKSITDLTGDKDTVQTELDAVLEYYSQLKERCVAKPETYEDRKARREAEIAGLKEALNILENETAFMQRKRRSFRGTLAM